MEFSVNFSLNLMLLMCMKVLCVPLYAQIEAESDLYLVRLMVCFKVHVEQSHTHWKKKNIKRGWMVPMESLGAPKVILGVLGLYKPSAPGLVSDAPILQWNWI